MEQRLLFIVIVFYTTILLNIVNGLPSGLPDSSEDLQHQQQLVEDDEEVSKIQRQLNNTNRISNSGSGSRRELQITNACLEPKREGRCEAYIPSYYFNSETGDCELFIYGGCGGSGNRFQTLQSCEARCSAHLRRNRILQEPETVVIVNSSNTEVCEMTPAEGKSCHAYLPRWTYDVKQGKCIQFIYKGCGATGNNFINKYKCEQKCGNYKAKLEELLQSQQQRAETELESVQDTTTSSSSSIVENTIRPSSNKACQQAMDPGFCYGINKRYYYNSENSRCQSFIFGGCGGNDNNFQSSYDCMRTCGGTGTPAENVACSKISCPWNLYTHYTAMGCTPVYDGQACCPTRFECSKDENIQLQVLQRSNTNTTVETETPGPKCQYKGKSYPVGAQVPEASSDSACRAACTCLEVDEGKARIDCANIECPENLGAVPPGKTGCIKLYKKDSCCAHDYFCPNATITPGTPIVQPFKCSYESKEYVEGEKIKSVNGNKCQTCLCQKGFNGSLTEEFCEPIDCGIEIYYAEQMQQGCVPVYFKDSTGHEGCCPIGWECPDQQIALSSERLQDETITMSPETRTERFLKVDRLVSSDACSLPSETGPCRASRKRFYYNNKTAKCEQFTYGGCKGNKNNFVALKDCQRVCESNTILTEENIKSTNSRKSPLVRSGFIQSETPQPESNSKIFELSEVDPCTLEVKKGVCRGYFPRYYFSAEENKCLPFQFGGCRGNKNNFYTIEACEALCQNKIPTESLRLTNITIISDSDSLSSVEKARVEGQSTFPDLSHLQVIDITNTSSSTRSGSGLPAPTVVLDITEEDPCVLPPETGRCKGFIRRFYYDPEVKYCKRFTYGGCGGNGNNFLRLKECDTRCAPNKGKGLPGSGTPGISPRWRTVSVVPGSSNQPQQEITDQKPQYAGAIERCNLPRSIGKCKAAIPSFYYDVLTESCQNFTYGGCFGNANRFRSLAECENMCKNSGVEEITLPTTVTVPTERVSRLPKLIRNQTPSRNRNTEEEGGEEDDDERTPDTRITSRRQRVRTQNQEIGADYNDIPEGRSGRRPSNPNSQVKDNDKSMCSLSPQAGNCRGHNLRYYWHNDMRQCLPFIFSGCNGNSNNFLSESDCQSKCGQEPTIEEINQKGILSCTFGNETIPVGGRLGGPMPIDEETSCGIPICQCITPPALTCIQTSCPMPPEEPEILSENDNSVRRDDRLPCASPSCGPHCHPSTNPENGCPTCDCDNNNPNGFIIELSVIEHDQSQATGPFPVKGK